MMVRKQVYLRQDQELQIKRLARLEKRTEAEVIRDAVDEYAQSRRRRQAWAEEKKFIEKWLKQAQASAGGEKGWRREDAYDRSVFSRH